MHRLIIGMAPGTSLHGAEAVLLEVHRAGLDLAVRLVEKHYQPYPRDLRNLMLTLAAGGSVELKHVSLLHRLLGEVFALAVRGVADQARLSLQQVLCAGCASHSLWHDVDSRYPSLLDAGMPAVVADRTGLTTLSDCRSRDLAAGGLGTPVEALADYLLFRDSSEDRALVHLGGTAKVVYLSANGRETDVLGFDAGPCNLLLDSLVRHCTAGRESTDPGGKYAVQGRCVESLLDSWLEHPYWQRRLPKALPPTAFGDAFAAQVVKQAKQRDYERNDLLCTATHLIARGIAMGLAKCRTDGRLPQRVLLSGGGVRNGLLWQLLQQQLGESTIAKTDTVGVPAECRRAMAHGILAALTIDGVPANLPTATGASGSRLLGSLTPGSPANWARCVTWMAQQPVLSYRLTG